MARWKMVLRVVSRALWVRPAKLFSSLAALTVGATLASAFLSLYFDLPRKMTAEFRTLGPNLVVAPRGNAQTFSAELYARLAADSPEVPRLPWLYAIGKVEGNDVILGGTDLARLAALRPGWQVFPSLDRKESAQTVQDFLTRQQEALASEQGLLAGEKAAAHFRWSTGQVVRLDYGGTSVSLPLLGIVSSGGSEDSQLLVPLPVLQTLTGQPGQLSLIQLAAPGSAAQVESIWQKIAARLPEAEVRPLRPVLESEARVVMKVRGLMLGLTAIVLGLVILSVLTTVSGLVLDRQRDIGIMKALGGSDRAIALFFLAETACLAVLAAALGYGAGFGLAQLAAQRIFRSAVDWRGDVLGAVVGITVAVALIATAFPARWIRRLDPAVILRGE